MTIQFLNKEGEATLTLSGRLDTAVSSKVSSRWLLLTLSSILP